ncbi:MAG: Methyltransferase type 12 [Candidatus Falkowbacteria bacterium GW2011_GWC2_38_22]|uniref:Methyltransferase type 12 n=1 Tax=Candidatus Falkowbacteria bacterium GW2011_GWE1_38_31 TaxID=1618638 RepID=A0A0G0K6W0_9BACT|nr:MAG: Methyltransferase type 12 [Candidatus Falkowbacteria bacterium GW2011_GWF2_38_1205]KKQ61761.1 MAG: Methyltransferase type 12 [Candidatus Falkowbacteria bacterium GW2011_GWC2_38_22]KKQ64069.1 MAG: Methyltransferase type 12 [Candidatus Falkowbacteria bacterium GW2011_GWF1_38_22]KKQ66582.1 MAG: Methyltransferase type 12 [Candidatus Falkowbacteria bacterium GW2011_GWE2_38_254]KKQ71175.1 MAG: Methyltransferase type 12 [Candidatus Falkowbacteria bacterium GW2011_GWE1_38_31]KKQ73303.1 MAG: Me
MLYFIYVLFNVLVKNHAPFISTRKSIIEKIIKEIDIKQDAVVLEIGCGEAKFLRALRQFFPKAQLIGLEFYIWPLLIAKLKNKIHKSKLELVKTDFLKYDFSKADLLYCFLNVGVMKTLEPKIIKECRLGTKVISYSFLLPNKKPDKVIEVSGIGEKVYFYTI